MPSNQGDKGDEDPRRPSKNKRPVRKTHTAQTQKWGNTAAASLGPSIDGPTGRPRKPIRERSTDQPLMAPNRANDRIAKRQTYDEQELAPPAVPNRMGTSGYVRGNSQLNKDEEGLMLTEPTPLDRTSSEESNLKLREHVMAQTVFNDDSSYAADQKLTGSLRREQQDEANLMAAKNASAAGSTSCVSDEDLKVSLIQEQQEQAALLTAKNASTAIGDAPDIFHDEHTDELSSATPVPLSAPRRQTNTQIVLQPGAYQRNPGEGYRRNSSNWKRPFFAGQVSSTDSERPTYRAPDADDRRAPPSLHASTSADNKDDLVQASPVPDDEAPLDPSKLELARPAKQFERERRRRRLLWLIGVLIALLSILIVGLIVGLIVRSQRKDAPPDIVYGTRAPSMPPTSPPTLAPSLPYVEMLPHSTLRTIQTNSTSPQALAYQWVGGDPSRATYSRKRAQQRFALATLYFSTGEGSWKNASNWLDNNSNECDWFGDNGTGVCNTEGDYLRLQLANNTLSGTIPPEIGLLTTLEVVDFSDNQMQGSLASEMGLLTDLTSLFVSTNSMEGSLPTELGLLSRLEKVHIFNNNFQSILPTELGRLTNMLEWRMKRNNISGAIPTEIGNWNLLKDLWTWNTELTGTLPTELGLLTSLTYLAMHNGAFQGTIPTEFGLLTNLDYLQMDVHELTGTIPSELGQLENIVLLSFGANKLVSTIPTELGTLSRLQRLRFYQNQLSGSIPTQLGLMSLLQTLELDDNRLVGSIPSELAQPPFLSQLFLANNQLTGQLPPSLGDLHYLEEVTLMNNQLIEGSIPEEWEALAARNLKELFLIGVNITGSIPSGLCAIDRLALDCNANVCGCGCQTCR